MRKLSNEPYIAAIAGLAALASPASAGPGPSPWQDLSLRSALEPEDEAARSSPASVACDRGAARFEVPAGRGLWVVRTGSVTAENPLLPLSTEELVVFEVIVDGRLATAYGPSYAALRQGRGVAELEAQAGTPVRWDATVEPRSATFSTVGQDGSPLLGPFAFQHCASIDDVTASIAKAPVRAAAAAPASADRRPPRVQLPQGAIPETRRDAAPRLAGR